MPSQFSAIGFRVTSGEGLASLASHVAERADTIEAGAGQYLRWSSPSGEQLWLQLKHNGDAMGMTPHFAGKSRMTIAVEARIARETHTPLDGSFLGWLNPSSGPAGGGETPIVFDCPDAALHRELALPAVASVQIAAFAQNITVHASESAYREDQAAQGLSFSSRSFIPSGLVSPSGEPVNPPEPHALFSGHVLETSALRNSISGDPFCWALVETIGGTVDVVIDPESMSEPVRVGGVISGWFWLSGRLIVENPSEKRGRFRHWWGGVR